MTDPRSIPSERDPDLANAEIALKRAVRQVRERARCTGTALAYMQDGRLKIEPPSDGSDQEFTMDAWR